jgi:hypothetical protein
LKPEKKLFESMSIKQFDNGYWYVGELKDFARSLGIPNAVKLRKDELENAIKTFIATGAIANPTTRELTKAGPKDVTLGLTLDLPVRHYTNDGLTKSFIYREADKLAQGVKKKTGVLYRLNRWREEALAAGTAITYLHLVEEYVRLCQSPEAFETIPRGRYAKFASEFFAGEDNATREEVKKAWETLKSLDIPKDFASWKNLKGVARSEQPTIKRALPFRASVEKRPPTP